MICKNKRCHQDIPDDARFCPYCGRNQSPDVRRRRKRGNGEGTVYKRSDVKSHPWVAYTPAKMDKYGRMKPEKIGSFSTEQEAREALKNFRLHPVSRLSATLDEIYVEWFPVGVDGKSNSWKYNIEAAYKKLATIKGKKIRDLRLADLQGIIDYYKEEHVKLDANGNPVLKNNNDPDVQKGLSWSSLAAISTLLGMLYSYAMQNDIVYKDYSSFIKLPPKPEPKKEYFSDLEFKKIENSVGKIPYADYIYIMCYTGHRVEEFLSLDFYHYDTVQKLLIGGNKTTAGKNKIVPVHPKIQHLVEQCVAQNGETIFCDKKDGSALSYERFCRKYYTALEQIGVRTLSPHATRRTFATHCDMAGIPKEDIRALMGHSGTDVDDRHYITKTVERLKKSITKIA